MVLGSFQCLNQTKTIVHSLIKLASLIGQGLDHQDFEAMVLIIGPICAVFFADEQANNWIQTKSGFMNDQMTAPVWLAGLNNGIQLNQYQL